MLIPFFVKYNLKRLKSFIFMRFLGNFQINPIRTSEKQKSVFFERILIISDVNVCFSQERYGFSDFFPGLRGSDSK